MPGAIRANPTVVPCTMNNPTFYPGFKELYEEMTRKTFAEFYDIDPHNLPANLERIVTLDNWDEPCPWDDAP